MPIHNTESLFIPQNRLATLGAKEYFSARSLLEKGERCEEPLGGVRDPKCLLRQGDYDICICLADSPGRRNLVNRLIKNMYSWRGYHTEHAVISSQSPHQLTLEASTSKKIAGTLTIGLDSEKGMLVDALYEQEISAFRAGNNRLCELSKLAISPQHSSKELLASLFNLAYIYARMIHKVTYFFIEVNPRHAAYYKRMLGFTQIGKERVCPRVNAPAVLLHLDLAYVDEQVSLLAGSPEPSKMRSLYAYFLPKDEEERVVRSFRCHMN